VHVDLWAATQLDDEAAASSVRRLPGVRLSRGRSSSWRSGACRSSSIPGHWPSSRRSPTRPPRADHPAPSRSCATIP